MPLPTPRSGEDERAFVSRCMGDATMRADFAEQDQRAAVCYRQWRAKKYSDDQPRDERGRRESGGSADVPSATTNDGKLTDKLSSKEAKAVEMYASADGSELNGTLRDAGGKLGYINSKADRENIHTLDSAISKAPLDHAVLLYRGISDENAIAHMESSVGKQVEFPAYSSTTHDVGVARGYAAEEGAKGLTMEIHVPQGFPALNVGQAIPRSRPGSDEFVLPRGTVMQIHSVSGGIARATVLHSAHQYGT